MIEKQELENTLNIEIHDINLFEKAFTHRSFLNENKHKNYESNERLEFLGDAVLQLLTSEFLFIKYEKNAEGILTAYRASIVNTVSLAEEAKRLEYGKFLRMSRGEETTGGRNREYILANTFEAVLGAIFLSSGIEVCKKFLEKNLFYKIDKIVQEGEYRDAKSKFQEIVQEKYDVTPIYKTLKEWGPDHDKNFEVGVYIKDKLTAKGTGASKQKAENDAAKEALRKIES
ncbi:ribonuclease III [Patescibacteria group bacterium]|nr:ribonuclease III [Patescibacteria group bacterium]